MSDEPDDVIKSYEARNIVMKIGKELFYDKTVLKTMLDDEKYNDKPIAILSVAGPLRQGKSYLLNIFASYLEWLENGDTETDWLTAQTKLKHFYWRAGSKADTSGVWIYDKPFLVEKEDGTEIVVLLVDTQGSFDSSSTIDENAKIFGFSTLISSLQIFNLMRNIREDDLQHLLLFTDMAKLNSNNSETCDFQNLTLLVRDWPNSQEHPYGFEGGREFLENVLQTSDDQPDEVNCLRNDIKSCFSSINCCLLPYPGRYTDSSNSKRIFGNVEEDFKVELKRFIETTVASLEPKIFGTSPVQSSDFPVICETLSRVLKSNKESMAKSAREAVAQCQYQMAVSKAIVLYRKEMYEVIEQNENQKTKIIKEAIQNAHTTAEMHAWRVYYNHQKPHIDLIFQESQEKLSNLLIQENRVILANLEKIRSAKKFGQKKAFRRGLIGGAAALAAIGTCGGVAVGAVAGGTAATAASGFIVENAVGMAAVSAVTVQAAVSAVILRHHKKRDDSSLPDQSSAFQQENRAI